MKYLLLGILLPVSALAQKGELRCVASFDETSRYELSAALTNRQAPTYTLNYHTDDGLDLSTELTPSAQTILPGESIAFEATNGDMTVKAELAYEQTAYRGWLQLAFALDEAEPLELELSCDLN